jgi:hypothetical protein
LVITHGKLSSYTAGGCRCPLCRAAGTQHAREYRRLHPEKSKASYKKWEDKNLAKIVAKHRLYRHGLKEGDLERMMEAQNGRCASCRDPLGEKFHIDHDHRTKKVRGLLCALCNLTIGHAHEDPARLRAAAIYLEAHS